MKNVELSIHLDKNESNSVYYCGEHLTGKIQIDVIEERFKINGIKLLFSGSGKVSWDETKKTPKNRLNKTLSSLEEYINVKRYLVENLNNKDLYLDVGHYEYPFDILLQNNLPTSFEHMYGNIRYKLLAVIDLPWSIDMQTF